MDDLQFRRSIYANPKTNDKEVIAAKHADPKRMQFSKEVEQLDKKISSALNVNVPEDLCNKLLLRQAMESHQHQKRKNRVQIALAASVAFAIGLTVNTLQFSSAYANIGDYALAHVYHENNAFDNNALASINLASLNNKMATFNGSFAQSIGKIIAADYCRFDGVKSLHLVYQGESSPVNIFVVPARENVRFSNTFGDYKFNGTSINAGNNHVIVVGDKSESLTKWQENISNNTHWSI